MPINTHRHVSYGYLPLTTDVLEGASQVTTAELRFTVDKVEPLTDKHWHDLIIGLLC